MHRGIPRYGRISALGTSLLLVASANAGARAQVPAQPSDPSSILNGAGMVLLSANAEIYVKGPNGAPIDRPAIVTLSRANGQFFAQGTTQAGFVKFDHVPYSEFTAQIVAPGYQTGTKRFEIAGAGLVTITVSLQPLGAEDAAASVGFYALPPKVQKDVGKALEALRANKPNDAWRPLVSAQKNAPNNAEVEYLLGLYSSQLKNDPQACSYWTKALALNPKHLGSLLAVGFSLLHENKPVEATPYLRRALDVAPQAWRAEALLAEALELQGQHEEAIKHAERALGLDRDRAASAQLILVRAFTAQGDRDRAISTMQAYVQGHPADTVAAKDLERLKNPEPNGAASEAAAAGDMAALSEDAAALPIPSNWRPPNVDEKIPPVETGASCAVDDVVGKAGTKLLELVKDVDRFAATESLIHESINKYGLASSPEKRKFNYVVSIQEVQHGYLNVEEYRNAGGSPADFPDGVATNGLPALVLIFHPYNTPNFEMTCEGLARWNGGLAWQVHFKQRADKPNTIKRYRIGADGPSYPVALKGRAWISADNFQILRLETDLISPVPQIKLIADHSEIEYGPVKFAKGNVNMWLPQSADVYYDWKGKRIHRRHSFSNYLLFAVDDKQKITVPKVDDSTADTAPSQAPKQKPLP
jgi:tetratricopeptide (TPR) repeat protein